MGATSTLWEPEPVPPELTDWLGRHDARAAEPDVARVPANPAPKSFLLSTVRFENLQFQDHEFNPRRPDLARVRDLLASVRRLALLNPLVCAFLEPADRGRNGEAVVLIDGRHRYEALSTLAADDETWKQNARIDVKIYYGLSRSELFLLATYLNRNRRALKRGEYYKSVVRIFEERRAELQESLKRAPRESDVFRALHGRELNKRDFDLSIGRLVGMAAFDAAVKDSWFPLVGNNQSQLLGPETGLAGFAPLTAGNLAEFLRHLCRDRSYDDEGQSRRKELENVLQLGRVFRRHFLKAVPDRGVASATTVACKYWVLSSFGSILRASSLFDAARKTGSAPFSRTVSWSRLGRVVQAYSVVAGRQAEIVNKYRDTDEDVFLDRAWSYQTQRDQVGVRLLKELRNLVPESTTKLRLVS